MPRAQAARLPVSMVREAARLYLDSTWSSVESTGQWVAMAVVGSLVSTREHEAHGLAFNLVAHAAELASEGSAEPERLAMATKMVLLAARILRRVDRSTAEPRQAPAGGI